jgi:ABC-type dipeptide/oligopeptide/nickel transport system permease component
MITFILRRLVESVPVLLVASLVVFSMLHLVPGDPVEAMLGSADAGMSAAGSHMAQQIRQELGLDEPLPVQYVRWLGGVVHGDFGMSYVRRRPVVDIVLERLPSTLELAAAGLLIAAAVGLVFGIGAALKRNTPLDGLIMIVSLGGVSTPNFFLAMLLILVFSVLLGWLPATGSGTFDRLVLPAIALGYNGVAIVARLTRSSMLEVLNRPYVTTAQAKGLAQRTVVLRHALRNALIPIVTVIGLQVGHLVAGSVIVETVFARQGMGQLAIEAILTKDFPVVQAVILFSAVAYVLANLLVDIAYGFLDPRMRAGA